MFEVSGRTLLAVKGMYNKVYSLWQNIVYVFNMSESIYSLLLRMREEVFWLTVDNLASVSSQELPAITHLDVLPQHSQQTLCWVRAAQAGQALGVWHPEGAGSTPPHSGASSCFSAHPFSSPPKWGSPQVQVQDVSCAFWDTSGMCNSVFNGWSDLGGITIGQEHSHCDLCSRCFFF